MFVVFVLDADAVYSGYNSCRSDFEVRHKGETLKILGDFEIESCFFAPFIWTVFYDLASSILGYVVYQISRRHEIETVRQRSDTISLPQQKQEEAPIKLQESEPIKKNQEDDYKKNSTLKFQEWDPNEKNQEEDNERHSMLTPFDE